MIENCADLRTCERMLSPLLPTITLLGQIPLTEEDYQHLTSLIQEKLAKGISKVTFYLTHGTPTCFACFLVWTGIVGYRNGNYWSAIHEAIGEIDANWQSQWGQFFLDFLEKHQLPQFAIQGSTPYVTPILLHGLIPNTCLEAYFEQIIRPFVQRRRRNTSVEVVQDLETLRANNKRRNALEQEREQRQHQQKALDKKIWQNVVLANEYDEIIHLWQLEAQINRCMTPAHELSSESLQQEKHSEQIRHLEQRIQQVEQEQANCEGALGSFSEHEQCLLTYENRILEAISYKANIFEIQAQLADLINIETNLKQELSYLWAQISSNSWQEEYGKFLCQLPFEQLKSTLKELAKLDAQVQASRQQFNLFTENRLSWSRWWLTTSVAIVLTMLLGIAATLYTIGSAKPFFIIGIGFILILGILLAVWYKQRLLRNQKTKALQVKLQEAETAYWSAQQNVQILWGQAPVIPADWYTNNTTLLQSYQNIANKYTQLCALYKQRAELQQQLQIWQQQIKQVADAVGITIAGNTDVLETLHQELAVAREHNTAVQEAQTRLNNEVRPLLTSLKTELQALQVQVAEPLNAENIFYAKEQPPNNWPQVSSTQQLKDEAEQLRIQLEGRHPSFPKMERFLRSSGKDKVALRKTAEQHFSKLKPVLARISELNRQITYYPAAFTTVEEPIRRFLLYGGQVADQFLVDSVLLLQEVMDSSRVVPLNHDRVPQRVLTAFAQWWEQQSPEDTELPAEKEKVTNRQLRAPALLLEPNLANVVLQLPIQRGLDPGSGSNLLLEVTNSESSLIIDRFALRVYHSGNGTAETAALTRSLSYPVHTYRFSLLQDSNELQQWEIPLFYADVPYIAFDWKSKKVIKNAELPAGRVWLLLPKQATLTPKGCLLQEAAMPGGWMEYVLYGLDLTSVDELNIVYNDRVHRFRPSLSSTRPSIELVGNQPILGVYSDDMQIYKDQPPRLRIPIEAADELSAWHLWIQVESKDDLSAYQSYRLNELQKIILLAPEEGWAEITLTHSRLLGPSPIGKFIVRVQKLSYYEREFKFVVVPRLRISFDSVPYFPYSLERRVPVIPIKLETSGNMTVVPKEPAQLIHKQAASCTISTTLSEDIVHGSLILQQPTNEKLTLPLSFSIPKAVWRLEGLPAQEDNQWSDKLEEVWIGDWETTTKLFLKIKMPPTVTGQLALKLEHNRAWQQKANLSQDGIARFDLLALRDVLLQGPAVQLLQLNHLDALPLFEYAPLLRIRTRWEADEIECIQRVQGRTINLSISWVDRGKAEAKCVRLWDLTAKAKPVREDMLSGEVQQTEINAPATLLVPGVYLLQLVSVDPWSISDPVRPARTDPNTKQIEIVSPGSLRQGEIFTITTIEDEQGQQYQPKLCYQIKVDGKIVGRTLPAHVHNNHVLITRANEGWYIGHLLPPTLVSNDLLDPTLRVELLASNPFKFEYNASQDIVTAIEDCYGEGAMYCPLCGRLYWHQETIADEERIGHQLIGPVELLKVEWSS